MTEYRQTSGKSPASRRLAFEDYQFDPGTGQLWRGDGEIRLTPRAAALLAVLTERPTQLVTRQILNDRVWEGRAVGDDALTSCVQELRHALGDDPRRPRLIETRHRRGYRLLVPVAPVASEESPPLALPDKPSIAVLPFHNLSDDEGQQYFVDGVVDDIITALSRFRSLFVIARNSSFAYRGRSVDVKQVGRELGVRYVLEGSVRKSANRLRVTAQLVDAATGSHMWADRLEDAVEAVFEFQDQITENVVATIEPKILEAEIARARRKPSANLTAYDCYLRGVALFCPPRTRPGIDEALRLFGRAMELDPDFAAPYGSAIVCYGIRRASGWVDDQERDKAEVTRLIQMVPRVSRDDAATLSNIAWGAAYVLHDLPLAKWYIDQALDLNANLAYAWSSSGWINLWLGHPDTAAEHFQHALRRDPHANVCTGTRGGMAHACFFLGRYADAISWAESELRANPDEHGAMRVGTASAACAGNGDVAQRLCKQLQSIDPSFRVSKLADYLGPYRKPEYIAKYAEKLRMAGLPE